MPDNCYDKNAMLDRELNIVKGSEIKFGDAFKIDYAASSTVIPLAEVAGVKGLVCE